MPYLTGGTAVDHCLISLVVLDSDLLISAVLGAISELGYADLWEQYDAMTPEECASALRYAMKHVVVLQHIFLDDSSEPLTDNTGDFLRG